MSLAKFQIAKSKTKVSARANQSFGKVLAESLLRRSEENLFDFSEPDLTSESELAPELESHPNSRFYDYENNENPEFFDSTTKFNYVDDQNPHEKIQNEFEENFTHHIFEDHEEGWADFEDGHAHLWENNFEIFSEKNNENFGTDTKKVQSNLNSLPGNSEQPISELS